MWGQGLVAAWDEGYAKYKLQVWLGTPKMDWLKAKLI